MSPYAILRGKTAVITGSGRGIGRAIALELARHGANVAINYFRHPEQAEQTATEARALGGEAVVVRAHMGEIADVQRLVATTAETFGGVDIFVGNAASGVLKPVTEQQLKGWDWTMNINARSVLFGVQAATPYMKTAGWGRIIGVSSMGSRRVLPEYSVVGVSKAAIETLIRYLAVELAPHGIICNAVSPGLVETDALGFFPSKDQMLAEGLRRTPAGRFVTPAEIARVVAWLCTDDARMIVGQTLIVDGGYEIVAQLNMAYTIRPATAADDATIRAIIRNARLNPLSLDWRRFLVAEEDGRIIGIIQMKPHGDGSRELASLAVLPEHQGRGVGSALVHALLEDEHGPVYLTCASPLESYYKQFEFRSLSRNALPPYYRRLVRLVSVLETFARLVGQEMRLSVMRRDAQ